MSAVVDIARSSEDVARGGLTRTNPGGPACSWSSVTVTTGDGVELDGAVHGSAARPPASILMVHGLTWNFYRGMSRWLPPMLAEAGYPCLSLNMRDHDLREPKDFELAFHDLRAGVDYLWQRWGGVSCSGTATRATRSCASAPNRRTGASDGSS